MIIQKNNLAQSIFLTCATLINSLLGLIFYVIVARWLGVSQFGTFSFFLGFGLISAELGDLGMSASLVRFGAGSEFKSVYTIVLWQRILTGIIICGIFGIVAALSPLNFYLSAFVGFSLLMASLGTQSLLARQLYFLYACANILGNLFRLLIIYLIFQQGIADYTLAIHSFSLANIIIYIFSFVVLYINLGQLPLTIKGIVKKSREIFKFTKWIAASFSLTSLASKIDVPILYALSGGVATGIYSSAQKLTSVFQQIAVSVDGVYTPKFSVEKISNNHFKDYLLIVLTLSVGTMLVMPLSIYIIPLLLGIKYLNAIPIFNGMLIGIIFFFLSGPFASYVLYHKGKSNFHFFGSLGQLIVSLSLFIILVPRLGVWGTVYSFIGSQLFNLIYYLLAYRNVHHSS